MGVVLQMYKNIPGSYHAHKYSGQWCFKAVRLCCALVIVITCASRATKYGLGIIKNHLPYGVVVYSLCVLQWHLHLQG
jgi:hypothetical protein